MADEQGVRAEVMDAVEESEWRMLRWWLETDALSDEERRFVVEAASMSCDHDDGCLLTVVQVCDEEALPTVLTRLVERGKWISVGCALRRGVSKEQRKWALEEACKREENNWAQAYISDYIVELCEDEWLEAIVPHLVERRWWKSVAQALRREALSDDLHRWAVDKAMEHAALLNFTVQILPACAEHHIAAVLTSCVERELWLAVGKILCSQRGVTDTQKWWAIQEACRLASDLELRKDILPELTDDQLRSVLPTLVERGLCISVSDVLLKRVCTASQHRQVVQRVCELGEEELIIQHVIPACDYDKLDVALQPLLTRGLGQAAVWLLQQCVCDSVRRWAAEEETEADDAMFWHLVRSSGDKVTQIPLKDWQLSITSTTTYELMCGELDWEEGGMLMGILCETVVETVRVVWVNGWGTRLEDKGVFDVKKVQPRLDEVNKYTEELILESRLNKLPKFLSRLHKHYSAAVQGKDIRHPLFVLHFVKLLFQQVYKKRQNRQSIDALVTLLTDVPVVPDLQSVALRLMLQQNRWDVISHACLSQVSEQVRRQVFQAAVTQRQWGAVKRWADHALYDDQRVWAMGEAFRERHWHLYLQLARHGLTEGERIGVYCRVARYADWGVVCHMFDTLADVYEVKVLTIGYFSHLVSKNKADDPALSHRIGQILKLEQDFSQKVETFETLEAAVEQGEWSVVHHFLRMEPHPEEISYALKAAVTAKIWRVVMQLVRLETDNEVKDTLLTQMVKQRQWGVCRELLEYGVSPSACLRVLPALVRHCQWLLVAVVMGKRVGDGTRRVVLGRAMRAREGSVVWECLSSMRGVVSVEQRRDLFRRGLGLGMWQAVKKLMEEKDDVGLEHRDTVLRQAIKQHQWDTVDHCQRQGADIDAVNARGITATHRCIEKEDWEAVKELTVRGSNPTSLDASGVSALHIAAVWRKWDVVDLMIQYQGDIHLPDQMDGETPLQVMIANLQGKNIDTTLLWCAGQDRALSTPLQETALHAVSATYTPSCLYYLIARGVDPLAVTTRHHSALAYAVMHKECPQAMVAECIRLGFSTHQPHLTDAAQVDTNFLQSAQTVESLLASPVLLSVLHGLPVITRMLYESGACSNRELFWLVTHLVLVLDGVVDLTELPLWERFCFFRRRFIIIDKDSDSWSEDSEEEEEDEEYEDNNEEHENEEIARRHDKNEGDEDEESDKEQTSRYDEHDEDENEENDEEMTNRHDKPRVPMSEGFVRSAVFLVGKFGQPRSLKSLCRLTIAHCLTLRKYRQGDIQELPIPPCLRAYVRFADLTDPQYGQNEDG